MILANLAKPTEVAKSGMTLREALDICVNCDVPGIPFVNDAGDIVGRICIRETLRKTCIPSYVVDAAHVLGDDIHEVNIPELHAADLLSQPVDHYILTTFNTVTSLSPVIKGLAIMEQLQSDYLFLVDDGEYKGVVTHMGIAQRLLEAGVDDDVI
jgi:CBS domain-containing protein|tara:strand:- start:1243 stop:1707 length:465 start_codon:yes stop_codon:yes gene_type:complete